MSTPSAAWPVDALVGALGRSGWGVELDGRAGQGVRSALRALVDLLPHGSAAGKVTVDQVADVAGLSSRWTRRCMHVLEDLGILTWTRGHIERGRPRPGYVMLCKRRIAELVNNLRRGTRMTDRRKSRDAATRDRLAKLGNRTIRPRQRRNPLSVHAELSAHPSLHREETGPTGTPVPASTTTGDDDMTCIHGHPYPYRCALCLNRMKKDPKATPAQLLRPDPPTKPYGPPPKSVSDRVRAMLRQGKEHQDPLP